MYILIKIPLQPFSREYDETPRPDPLQRSAVAGDDPQGVMVDPQHDGAQSEAGIDHAEAVGRALFHLEHGGGGLRPGEWW